MNSLTEDVGVVDLGMPDVPPGRSPGNLGRLGPVVRRLFDLKKFEIEFYNAGSKDWLQRPENVKFLHDKLDEYIDWFVKE